MFPRRSPRRPTRILAVSSGGGHWVQMLRLRPAFAGAEVHFASVAPSSAAMVAPAPGRPRTEHVQTDAAAPTNG